MVIQCTNPTCRAWATQPVGRCPTCQTPLPYRFLLAVSDPPLTLPAKTLVANRYWVWDHPIWLDTQPEAPIPAVDPIPDPVLPYLRLADQTQHMARPYYCLSVAESGLAAAVLLLDEAPLAIRLDGDDQIEVSLLPSLSQVWPTGTALQQLNWLRQMASLWPALAQEKVAATLLSPAAIPVDQSLLRLGTLTPDAASAQPVTLATVGQHWQALVPQAQPPVRAYLGWLVGALLDGGFARSHDLAAELEAAIQTLAQGLSVRVDWGAATDQGPGRERNEDACYPQGVAHQVLSAIAPAPATLPLLVVCDGIGGHEQGNVASQTAIKILVDQLQPLAQQPELGPTAVAQRLKQAAIAANHAISSRNNDEHRSARARMGTTVVAALVHFPYVSIVHIGDSRAYRVSAQTCYQITLDDDVASREAHLGYALYSEATQMSGGGALVQALGINDSDYLYPTVQHLLMDDPCVLLLCSDGLSDYDRVDTLWPYTVRSLVGHASPLPAVAQILIQQANRLNGHDNVTVGLMRFVSQITTLPTLPAQALRATPAEGEAEGAPPGATAPATDPRVHTVSHRGPSPRLAEVQSTAAPARRRPWLPLLGGATVALLGLAGLGWFYRQRQSPPPALTPLAEAWPRGLTGEPLWALALAQTVEIPLGSWWQSQAAMPGSGWGDGLRLRPSPTGAGATATAPMIPAGSILRVVSRQTQADQTQWVRLEVCSIPAGSSLAEVPQESAPETVAPGIAVPGIVDAPALANRLSQPGAVGWVRSDHLYGMATSLSAVTPTQRGVCAASP